MKVHLGVDSETKLIHSVAAMPANRHDSQVTGELLHGNETRVWGDSAYTGQGEVIREKAPKALDLTNEKGTRGRALSEAQRASNRDKSMMRSRVEHVIGVVNNSFGFNKVRYHGLSKNTHHLYESATLVNLAVSRTYLVALCTKL